ncbi:MAG: GNAT family N-acetyltransferase [Pleurocapsa sp. MO_226.B13]|nr:GNAT family N-acetyltransferase [Pleurocapsa sp. MO_226.B13]
MAIAQNLSLEEFADYIKLLGKWADKEELTVIARNKSTDEVVGTVIAGDFASDSPLNPEDGDNLSKKFEPIVKLLESLETQYKQGKQIRTGEYLHIYMLAVSPDYQRKKIAQNIIQICLNKGIQSGFTRAFTEAANSISQHIFKKLNFKPRHQISYKEFTDQGIPVFADIEGHEGTILMDKCLESDRSLNYLGS